VSPRAAGTEPGPDDPALVARLRAGDEAAFLSLVRAHHDAMLRVAMAHVPGRAVAEEVVQETWLAALRGLERFEGRSSVKTWLFRILVNRARTRGPQERRSVPFSALAPEGDEGSVDADRFLPAEDRWAGHWIDPPRAFGELPEDVLLGAETRRCVEAAIATLRPAQREVITLRDVDGWSAAEVCEALELSEANQRVLLHRARSVVRRELERYLELAPAAPS
jgi:RNA polymerase sigma-70 factor (ECF subfamily)